MAATTNPHAARAAATLTIIFVSAVVKEVASPQGTDWPVTILEVIGGIIAGVAAVGTLVLGIVKYKDKKERDRRRVAG
jgi:hypothetical protein